jgi:TolB-like protein/Tfp pilus assembly protein PilF
MTKMAMTKLVEELKHRKVVRVAGVYAVVAWLLIQVANNIVPALLLPAWTNTFFVVLLLIGFPIALVLAWAFEITPTGVQPQTSAPLAPHVTSEGLVRNSDKTAISASSKGMEYALIGLLSVAVLWLIYRDISQDAPAPATDQAAAVGENLLDETGRVILPNSIAVLPFANFSPDPNNAFFAAGIHDTILHELSQIKDMNVISRTTMMRYANSDMAITDIARELRVGAVMEGSVQYAEGRVLVTAQLIDPETDAHLWSGNYDREFADIFFIQADIATRIAGALQATLTPQEVRRIEKQMTSSAEAYALYLSFMEAIDWDFSPFDAGPEILVLLDRAIELDPGFSQAYAAKAAVWAFHYSYVEQARESAAKALELDPENAMAYAALALLHTRERKYDEARKAWEQAHMMNPNDADILDDYLRFVADYQNDPDLALRLLDRLLTIDPGRQGVAGLVNMKIGNLQAARNAFLRAAEAAPNTVGHRLNVSLLEQLLGNPAASATHLNIAAAIPVTAQANNLMTANFATAAWMFRRLGRADKAQQYYQLYINANARVPIEMQELALDVCALLGAGDEAAALEKMRLLADRWVAGIGDVYTSRLIKNSEQDPVLETPAFLEQRRRMGHRGESN